MICSQPTLNFSCIWVQTSISNFFFQYWFFLCMSLNLWSILIVSIALRMDWYVIFIGMSCRIYNKFIISFLPNSLPLFLYSQFHQKFSSKFGNQVSHLVKLKFRDGNKIRVVFDQNDSEFLGMHDAFVDFLLFDGEVFIFRFC